jgi:hypothetical protein
MTAVAIGGGGLWAPDTANVLGTWLPNSADLVLNAANTGVMLIGTIRIDGGGSKTISSAGGKIHFLPSSTAITFSNASTNVRVGIQDVNAAAGPPARGDLTFDVFDDLVGGTDSITPSVMNTVTMSSGTKTIANGDLICVAFTMTARGGADTFRVNYIQAATTTITTINQHMPQVVSVTAGPTYTGQTGVPNVVIEFDDGTLGFLDGGWVTSSVNSTANYVGVSIDSATSPDEYAMLFKFAAPVTIDAVMFIANPEGTASSEFEVIVYSGGGLAETPVALATITVDPNQNTGNNTIRRYVLTLPTPLDLTANATYALAIRPTTTNNVSVYYHEVGTAAHWKGHALGTDCFLGGRTNQGGAFGQTTTQRLLAAVRVSKISDGSGGGGSVALPPVRVAA